MREAVFATVFSAAMVAAVVSPVLRDPPADSFPLSDYPMFSHGRPSPMFTLTHALGIDAEEERTPLEPLVSSGNREVLQSMVTIEQGVHHGAPRFCEEIATRVAADHDLDDVVAVELVTDTWDTVAYFDAAAPSQHHEVHARCEVRR